jgi:hypothetical protein
MGRRHLAPGIVPPRRTVNGTETYRQPRPLESWRARTWPDVNAIRIKGDVLEELYVRHAGDRSGSRTC